LTATLLIVFQTANNIICECNIFNVMW